MDYGLTDPDLILLVLIAEQPGINGYGIRQLVTERGIVEWAGVASSSIYNGLKRLVSRGLVTASANTAKQGRGPNGQTYLLTSIGAEAMRAALAGALAATREHDPRFAIALSGIHLLGLADAADCLEQRAAFLSAEAQRISGAQRRQGQLPLPARLLFDRSLSALEAERAWTTRAAGILRESMQERESS